MESKFMAKLLNGGGDVCQAGLWLEKKNTEQICQKTPPPQVVPPLLLLTKGGLVRRG